MNMDNLKPFEVVGRCSETQLQLGENLYHVTLRFMGEYMLNTIYWSIHMSNVSRVSWWCTLRIHSSIHRVVSAELQGSKLLTQILDMWLGEMAISANHMCKIWVNPFENTAP